MALAINIRADNRSADEIERLWDQVAALEVEPSMRALGYRPHFTFAIYDSPAVDEKAAWDAMLSAVADGKPLLADERRDEAIAFARSFGGKIEVLSTSSIAWSFRRSGSSLSENYRCCPACDLLCGVGSRVALIRQSRLSRRFRSHCAYTNGAMPAPSPHSRRHASDRSRRVGRAGS